jgi:hypothetical protein
MAEVTHTKSGNRPRCVPAKRPLILERQQLDLSASVLAPAEIIDEAEQRRAPGVFRTTAVLQIPQKSLADVLYPIA